MALTDDLHKLAAQDVVYLTRTFSQPDRGPSGPTQVFRGRLREALNGEWVFNASTGQNGVVGFMLGSADPLTWRSDESPATGLQVTITFMLTGGMGPMGPMQGTFNELIVLTTLIPTDFAD